MCGIVAYTGCKEAYPILIKGLKRLEYRGYDSAGVSLAQNGTLSTYKQKGSVDQLDEFCMSKDRSGKTGIGHTRWATHGEPSTTNAHPHLSSDGRISIIHNGIIENYVYLREELTKRGYQFQSETDTEVLAHLIEDIYKNEGCSLEEAVRIALKNVVGAYALAILSADEPDQLILAKKGSPLLIGIGNNEYFIGSDGSPIVEYTRKVVYLEDGDVAVVSPQKGLTIKNIDDETTKRPYLQKLELNLEQLEKGGFEHFMLKEIFEQPRAIKDSMRGRLNVKKDIVELGGIREYEQKMLNARRIIIVACGTSWHAGTVGEYLFESIVRIPVEVEYASEFRYRNPLIYEDDIVIAISQSGETADTLAALRYAKGENLPTLSIVNAPETAIAREADHCLYTHAGPEIAVATTKGYATQLSVLWLLAIGLANEKNVSDKKVLKKQTAELFLDAPKGMDYALSMREACQKIGKKLALHDDIFYIGRGNDYALSMEAALKLKEISYIHCEAYAAGELKHGTISLIEKGTPVLALSTDAELFEKMLGNIKEVGARGADVLLLCREDENIPSEYQNQFLPLPSSSLPACVFALLGLVQLLAYETAKEKGCDIDKPRNLAKSVTVE